MELNPEHPVFAALAQAFEEGDEERTANIAWTLYGQSMLAEGLEIPDFSRYFQAVYGLV